MQPRFMKEAFRKVRLPWRTIRSRLHVPWRCWASTFDNAEPCNSVVSPTILTFLMCTLAV